LRLVEGKENKYTKVICNDDPAIGNGACHKYSINSVVPNAEGFSLLSDIDFQDGPILESGVNGVQNEDLLVIVADRLRCFQGGNFACRENAIALTKIEEALLWLNKRTQDRINRGVEGKNII
jgi:hypothetical protein